MTDTTQVTSQLKRGTGSDVARRIGTIGWAAFFIWIGTAILVDVGWGWFLAGVGAIVLVGQMARWTVGAKLEAFWIICGSVFLAAGVWELLSLKRSLAPLLVILLGIALLWQAFFDRSSSEQ